MRVAVLQFKPVLGDVRANVRIIVAAIAAAAAQGATMLVAPEMCLTGWTLDQPELRTRLAHETEEVALPALSGEAVRHAVALVVGGPVAFPNKPAHERADAKDDDGQMANAAIWLGIDGGRADYRKIHLFGPERDWWRPGSEATVTRSGGIRVGLTICYDAEFPEVPRMARLAGAELIVVPTTNMSPYEHDQDVVFATRALEHECPVVVANRVGSEGDWTYFGRSLIVDERGRIVAQAGSSEELLLGDIQPNAGTDPALAYLASRRPDVYTSLVDPALVAGYRAPSSS
jgi:predicted amidohydrolase